MLLPVELTQCTRYIAYSLRLDKAVENVEFHDLQEALQAILSGYKALKCTNSSLKDLVTMEDWAREKFMHSLDTDRELSATDGGALVKIIVNNKDPKYHQK